MTILRCSRQYRTDQRGTLVSGMSSRRRALLRFTPNPGRIDDVLRLADEYKADGILHYALQFCGPYQIEATTIERAAREAGIPVLRVDTDYSMEDAGQLGTRIEAFLEMLQG
jgi:benzoyl-CoA reductase/2-hydroxyglutaryl-CoA dehydratase subunit BcrC/BadD/HgdB